MPLPKTGQQVVRSGNSIYGRKSKTLIIIGGFELPDKNAAAQRIKAMAALFNRAGYRVVLIGGTKDQAIGPFEPRRLDFPDIDAEIWEVGNPRSKREWLMKIWSIKPLEAELERKYGSELWGVICYNYPALAQMSAARFARRLGGAALADVSEWYGTRRPTSLQAIIKNIDTWLRMRWVNFKMDGIISCSPFLTRYYGSKVKALVQLPTLILADTQSILDGQQIGSDNDPKKLFFAGSGFDLATLHSETGGLKDQLDWVIDLLAKAANQGASFVCDVYGVNKTDYLEVCPHHQDILQQLGSSVVFHGRQPWATVIRKLRAADFSIFLRKETRVTLAGFPTKFTEAILNGTPVLTNPLENVAPYITEGKTGFALDMENREVALQTLLKALALSAEDILRMKKACATDQSLSIKTYVPKIQMMMGKIERESSK
ncbi:glycosyltransferase [Profundibacter sp.]